MQYFFPYLNQKAKFVPQDEYPYFSPVNLKLFLLTGSVLPDLAMFVTIEIRNRRNRDLGWNL